MPSKKQRRRREKLQRHEYEYVLETDEGEEVIESPRAVEAAAPKNGKPGEGAGRAARPPREADPEAVLQRVLRRTAIFAPLIALFIYFTAQDLTVAGLIFNVALLLAFFMPLQLRGRHGRLPHALAAVREGARREARPRLSSREPAPSPAPVVAGPGQGASRSSSFAPDSVRDRVALVGLEADERPAGASTASPPARKVARALDDDDPGVLLHLVVAELLAGVEADEHRPRLVLAAEDDRGAAPARRLDLGEPPGLPCGAQSSGAATAA